MGAVLLFSPGCSEYESAREPESFPKLPSGLWGVWLCTTHLPLREHCRVLWRGNYSVCLFYEGLSGSSKTVIPQFLFFYPSVVQVDYPYPEDTKSKTLKNPNFLEH